MSDKPENTPDIQPQEPFAGAFDTPMGSPVQPQRLGLDDTFQFSCHPGISCFNECCRQIDLLLTPYDILRLKQRLGLTSDEFVAQYTLPFEMDFHGLPGLKMATKPGTRECVFLGENGCTVYEDRPAACRYYALGSMGMRKKDTNYIEDVFFVVKEDHCQGHYEPKTQTVGEYRTGQGVDKYDQMNAPWREIIIKKRSAGPTVGAPSERSMQLFDMCSYDMDSFRRFVQSDGFQTVFDVPEDEMQRLLADEEALLIFAMRFLKQVLFGERTIALKEGARDQRVEQRKARIEERKQAQDRERRARMDVYKAEGS